MKEEIFLFFIGTAGSGKSTLTDNFKEWMELKGLDAITINLDPGAENLPYNPDVDIRDWISLKEIMETYKLGPNGAQIACADMLALNLTDLQESIEKYKSDIILIDTPGQLELFVFREAGKHIVDQLKPKKTMIAYLLDHNLAKSASGFTSQLLLSINTSFRLNQPQIHILTKADMLTEEEIDKIKQWTKDNNTLYDDIMKEQPSIHREMNENIIQLIQGFQYTTQLIPTSKIDFQGIEDIYTNIQLQFYGGEDILKD